jgi:putative N6-adenine-specific DNA methylase
MKLFAVCAPGLEPFLAREMKALSLKVAASDDSGGVAFDGDLPDVYRANLWLRTASRVQAQVGMDFMADSFVQLHQKAAQLPWERYLVPGQVVDVHVTSQHSRLSMKRDIARHVEDAISERLKILPSPPAPLPRGEGSPPSPRGGWAGGEGGFTQLILIRIDHDRCTARVDSSGEHLHRRGYKLAVAKAPLRETLAAGMLLASGWDGHSPLLDPFCGSGTIPIEAALLGLGVAPGARRRFQFEQWPGFDGHAWQEMLRAADSQRGSSLPKIVASDRDAGAIEMSTANAERAGVGEFIQFSHRAVSSIEPIEGRGWVVTNPPYGERVSEGKDLRNLYARFGDVVRAQCPGWRVALLCNDDALLRQTRFRFVSKIGLDNGGIDVQLGLGSVG